MTDPHEYAADDTFRLYTVDEANALLPTLAPMLEELRRLKSQLDTARAALKAFTPAMRSNGHGLEALGFERQIAEIVPKMAEGIKTITDLGIEIKDLDAGLIDFPSPRGGRIVYLCWRLGEGEIAFWHELDAGFSGRQPL